MCYDRVGASIVIISSTLIVAVTLVLHVCLNVLMLDSNAANTDGFEDGEDANAGYVTDVHVVTGVCGGHDAGGILVIERSLLQYYEQLCLYK